MKKHRSKIPYSKPSLKATDIKLANIALRSDFLTGGRYLSKFEAVMSKKFSSETLACSSGTSALLLAIMALKIFHESKTNNFGDKKRLGIIVASLNFVAGANQIKFAGFEVIFCDCDPVKGVARYEDFIEAFNSAKRAGIEIFAFMPMHLGGKVMDLKKLASFAKKNNIYIIEDACHAIGSIYRKKYVGACIYSDISCFSFHAIKNIALGEGGAISTNNNELTRIIKDLRSHGKNHLGLNARLSEVACALGYSQFLRLDKTTSKRNSLANYYDQQLLNHNDITIINNCYEDVSAYHLYQIMLSPKIRDKVRLGLAKHNIESQIHYIPSHSYSYHKNILNDLSLNNTISFAKSCLAIPLFVDMTKSQQNYVIQTLIQVIASQTETKTTQCKRV